MNNREIKAIDRSMLNVASMMSEDGLKAMILEDWNNPKWKSYFFDIMHKALEKKIGKRAYDKWFNALPSENAK